MSYHINEDALDYGYVPPPMTPSKDYDSKIRSLEMNMKDLFIQNAYSQRQALQRKTQALESKIEDLHIQNIQMKNMISQYLKVRCQA